MGHSPYYNQKVFRFINAPKDQLHPYSMFNKEAIKNAMVTLTPNAFKLYIYLGSFKELPDAFNLSRQNAMQAMDISKNSYLAAVKELQTKGYIAEDKTNSTKDTYIFIEHPEVKNST